VFELFFAYPQVGAFADMCWRELFRARGKGLRLKALEGLDFVQLVGPALEAFPAGNESLFF
jgi:hypothetical protein